MKAPTPPRDCVRQLEAGIGWSFADRGDPLTKRRSMEQRDGPEAVIGLTDTQASLAPDHAVLSGLALRSFLCQVF